MLVYGDPQFQEHLRSALMRLRALAGATDLDSLEQIRSLLIQAGQVEQAVQDHWCDEHPTAPAASQTIRITDCAAVAFLSAWSSDTRLNPNPQETPLSLVDEALAKLCAAEDVKLTIKVPEGFEFYALFPEQYCASALKWAEKHAGTSPRRAVVIGIRSIGTTLSAVVAGVLKTAGWQVQRLTVRPTGHPFSRRVELNLGEFAGSAFALVVDEGPGISGSSMAVVAQALSELGIPDISFLPGHEGEPGSAASPEVRGWWARTPRYHTPLKELRWNGLPLPEHLIRKANELWPGRESFKRIEDLSAGAWRRYAFDGEQDWPAVSGTFERMKFKCTDSSGCSVLWKFAGFGGSQPAVAGSAVSPLERVIALAGENLIPPPLGSCYGFVAAPWVKGTRLSQAEATDDAVLDHIGRYVVLAAGPPLSESEANDSVSRLAEMLYWNTREAFGEELVEQTRSLANQARSMASGPTYGDGRMAPYEWVRTPKGQLFKTDAVGHDLDHTLVGRQSLLWDVAGTTVEWNLGPKAAERLLRPLREARISVQSDALRFYEAAYAAFRLGLTSLLSQQTGDSAEQARLHRALKHYRDRLERIFEF